MLSNRRPLLITSVRTWEEYAQLALELVKFALIRLYDERHSASTFPNDETQVSLCLSGHLRRVVNERGVEHGLPQPSYDAPQSRDISVSADDYERTKPDVRWMLADLQNSDINRRTRAFDVECKRIGLAIKGNNFNRKYVT